MDFGNAPRANPVAQATIVPRADVVATPDSVSVDLPPEQTVQSAPAGDAVRVDISQRRRDEQRQDAEQQRATQSGSRREAASREPELRDVIERRLVIEPRTRSVVLQKKNLETGEVELTLPSEAILKLRLLAREIADRARAAGDATARYIERSA